ncbi:MAG TPA: glycoside hydrolase family 38 C-terminal domain-containing protein, partial [Candidatus Dormibacteraeota bacterium]|nr:glycoside hydrolase family 38 C-terminal domain-containing protein [Candidatus Dormibacteraeota bacterium]
GVMRGSGSPDHTVHATGHAHIDTAWLWPLREARRKCARTFSTQLALMDEYPDHRFACSQPAQYEWMKESYPAIYARIQEKVASGQWEPVGAMWVEADCNLPAGEALVRQVLHGKRFFMREFGYETDILWLPDVFGYPGNLPQIIAASGCRYFLTQKLSWNDTNKPEHHTFLWEGIDGTRIFTHFPPADTYNGDFSRDELEAGVRHFKDAPRSNRSLYLFGWGDGGGGPQPEMIDAAHRFGVQIGSASDFFVAASEEARDLAVVKGELYFELHRGTYTSQSRTKRLNRLAQEALRQAEMWSVAAGDPYPRQELERAWKALLLNQFHDILPGSSIDWVYADAERDLSEVVDTADALVLEATSRIAGAGDRVAVFNSTSRARGGAPPYGWAVVGLPPPPRATPLENDQLRVELGDGTVNSIWDKEARREVLRGPGNVFELHDDNPRRWDAWDLDIEHRDSLVVVGRRFGQSTITQRIWLDGRMLRFDTEVDWHERHKILKVAFPVTVSAREATYEVQFGHVQRPTHFDDSRARAMFEVPAQRWADLGDGDYGVALLNDCKHGYDIHDSVMRLSLLRAPTHPDPSADQGRHRFTFALLPHGGDWREAGVIQAAEELNSPLRQETTSLPVGTSRSLVAIDTP